jgi:hypothetical protein
MILNKIFGLLGQKRPFGLSIELGTTNSILGKAGYSIRGSGPYMKMYESGYRWKRTNRRAFLAPAREPNPHILISGMSGFGKSMFFKSVIVDVTKANVSCIIFDGHNEHNAVVNGLGGQTYDSRNGGINLLSLDGATVLDRTSSLVSLLSSVYHLGHIQATKLGQCLRYTYRRFGARGGNDRVLQKEPKVADLIFEIGIFIKNAQTASEKATLQNLQSKISNLNTPAFNRNVAESGNLKRGIHSFSISERMSKEARLIYLVELLERVYTTMKDDPKDGKIRQYIMIDESQVLINESEECSGVITKFIEEGRKYGRGVIIVTHMSSKLNRQIVANASAFMAFYSREPSEAAYVTKVMASNFEAEGAVRSKLATLQDGEALMISAKDRTPKVVATVGLHKKIEIYKTSEAKPFDVFVERPIKIDDLSVKTGMKPDQIRELTGKELTSFVVDSEEWIMKRANPGIEHEVMVSKIQAFLQASGITSYVYDRANGPDIVAYGKEGKIALEYETGSKDLDDSIGMFRSRKPAYSKVIVVVKESEVERYRNAVGEEVVVVGSSSIANILPVIRGV